MSIASLSIPFYKVASIKTWRIQWKPVSLLLASLCLVLLVSYVYSVNMLTEGTFVIKDYNKQIDGLAQENQTLQTTFAESDFLAGIQQKAQGLQFEKTAQVHYVKILDNSLAKAR